MTNDNPWPDRIKALRRRRGWTQEDLARRLKTRRETVADWERGKHHPRGPVQVLIEILEEET